MMKFDNAKYRTVLNLIKKTGEFKGKAVPSKARLHEMIGDALGISHNTVKDWERATSNGPDPRIPGNMIEVKKIALPTAVYKAMMNFMDQVVEPYVFEDTTEIFSEEEAKRNEKGIVEIKSEQAFQKLMVRFMEKLSELDAKIETFAESELKPYLER